jgi:hypothetical protein
MSTRAERRRTLRAAGQKRADGKRGRRGAIRAAELQPDSRQAVLERLYAQGVTIAKPRIWTPDGAA